MNINHDPVRRALAALAEVDRSRRAPPYLERAVVDAFDRDRQRGYVQRCALALWMYRREVLAITIAAMVTTTVYYRMPSGQSNPSHIPAPPQAPVVGRPSEQLVAPRDVNGEHAIEVAPPGQLESAPRAARKRTVQADVDLSARTWRRADDVVHSVHVQVPRTMLPLLGVPVIDPDASGTVKVEFLLGNDGLARTIRILP